MNSSDSALTWNDKLGLCRQEGPGHTAPVAERAFVHNGVFTATRLGFLAQCGALQTEAALATLRSLRAMQAKEPGERQGCLRWYWEEKEPVDTNAAFFIGMALMVLYLAESGKLDESVRAAIREIVADLAIWFEHELDAAHPRYPNKCMGDLVCSWLAAEVLGRAPSDKLIRTTREWCEYWRVEHWGWGEHMSDGYTMVLLNELSAVLLFCAHLPGPVRNDFIGHFHDLLAINDVYEGGPRVPTIRSYAFTATPEILPFRQYIRPTATGDDLLSASVVREQGKLYGAWYHRAGWQDLAPKVRPGNPWLEIPCRDGAWARALVLPHIRIGAMSRFPIMSGIEHPTWGLSWQTFPVAFWRPAGDWGFWRWQTREGDRVRAHPALDKHSAYLGNALSAKLNPPPVPLFRSSLSPDGHLSMERTLEIPTGVDWDEVKDAFDLVDSNAEITVEGPVLRLRWSDCELVVNWRGENEPSWQPSKNGGRWVVRYDRAALAGCDRISHRWELTLR